MTPKYLFCTAVLLWLAYLLVSSSVGAQENDEEDERNKIHEVMIKKMNAVKNPLNEVASQVQALALGSMDVFDMLHGMEKVLVNLGPALMVVGMALSLITAFLPKQDSEELAFMKEKFDIVITGMNRVENKLSHIENVIIHENTKLSLGEYQRNIFALHEDWKNAVNAKKSQEKMFRDIFVDQYETLYKKSALNLWRAMTGSFDGVLNNNLLATAKERYKCNGLQIMKLCALMAQTINQGIALEGAYYTYTDSLDRIESEEVEWKERMKIYSESCEAVMKECRERWKDYALPIMNDVYGQYKSANNDVLAQQTYNTLSTKFGQRAWFVFVYNSVTGFEYHGYLPISKKVSDDIQTKWRENNKMFTVVSFDKDDYPSFEAKQRVQNTLNTLRSNVARCQGNYPSAKEKEAAKVILDATYDSAVVTYGIKSDINLKFYGTPGRYIRVSLPTSNKCPKYEHLNFEVFAMG